MSETIINSNQLRAEGDTSSKTLISLSQIRQEGDTSSETLLNKNQIASVPSRYTIVDYIQSSGTQYINTGYNLKAHDKVEVKLKVINRYDTYDSIFGARLSNANNNCYALFNVFANNQQWCFARTSSETAFNNFWALNVLYTITTKDKDCVIQKEGESANTYTTGGTVEDCVNPCGLFTLNTSSSVDGFTADVPSEIALYSFKIYDDNDILIRSYIPVYDTVTEKYGVYELVTDKKFLGNIGSGNFTGGND